MTAATHPITIPAIAPPESEERPEPELVPESVAVEAALVEVALLEVVWVVVAI